MTWTMRERRRVSYSGLSQPECATQFYSYHPSVITYDSPFTLSGLNIQHTVDVDRKVHPRRKDSLDDGGPFSSKRLEISFDRVPVRGEYRPKLPLYDTGFLIDAQGSIASAETNPYLSLNPTAINALWASISYPSTPLEAYGNKALLRVDPTRGVVPDPTEFIFELVRDGVPHLPLKLSSRLKTMRQLGGEYLNARFGWENLVRDIAGLVSLYGEIESKIEQLIKDENKPVRRKGTLSLDKSRTEHPSYSAGIQVWNNLPILFQDPSWTGMPTPESRSWTQLEERVWFSGRGRYVLPIELRPNPMKGKVDFYLSALSQAVSPSSVWELLPWSWLIDYFTNIGEVIRHRVGHGLGTYTLDYCYLMRKRVETTVYQVSHMPRYGIPAQDAAGFRLTTSKTDARCVVRKTTLERVAATPFGFGLAVEDLSGPQLAILTALGLSRQNFI